MEGADESDSAASRSPRRRLRGPALGALLLLLGLLGLPLLLAVTFPRLVSRHVVPRLLYFPSPLPAEQSDPALWGLPTAREVEIPTSDGVRLHGWWLPARPNVAAEPCGAAVFFHGNAGNLAGRASIADGFSRLGLDALLVDYRGYGRSGGRPDEEGLYRDGEAAYRFLLEERGAAPGSIVLAGHSLGGAVATHVAASRPVDALVVTAAFANLPDAARRIYAWLPDALFRGWSVNRFESEERIREIGAPLLVGRGARDDLMPREQTRRLYDAAPEPKRWVEVSASGHNDLWQDDAFWRELDTFLADAIGCS